MLLASQVCDSSPYINYHARGSVIRYVNIPEYTSYSHNLFKSSISSSSRSLKSRLFLIEVYIILKKHVRSFTKRSISSSTRARRATTTNQLEYFCLGSYSVIESIVHTLLHLST